MIDPPGVVKKIPLAETENQLSLTRVALSPRSRARNQIPAVSSGTKRFDGEAAVEYSKDVP